MKKLFFIILILGLFPSCLSRTEHPPLPLIVAFVNGKSIKEDALRFRINLERPKYEEKTFDEPERFKRLKKEILNRMIQNQIIIDWGEKKGIMLTSEDAARGMESLKKGYTEQEFEWMLEEKNIPITQWRALAEETLWVKKIIQESVYQKIKVGRPEIQAYYNRHQDNFREEEKVRVRQIVTDSHEKAEQLHKMLKKGENFAGVAIMHSISPDRATGGDLGYFARGTHPTEFDEACFNLKIGEISPIVKSPYGYHIFKLIDRRPAGIRPLEEVLPQIESALLQEALKLRYKAWLDEILAQSQIQIMDKALEKMKP